MSQYSKRALLFNKALLTLSRIQGRPTPKSQKTAACFKRKAKAPRPITIRWSSNRNDAGVFAALEALRQAGREILAKRTE